TAYLAMQLVRGPTLSKVLRDSRCLTWARAADIGAQIADALCAAQAQGIVHRDLKPDNVILATMPDGTELVKLLDFGIAKHARDSLAPPPMQRTQQVTRIGVVVGTLGYMAPEQAVGKRADHRSDLYALGALLWECLVGRRLWDSDDVQTLLAEQLNRAPRGVREMSGDTSIPDDLDQLISRLLEINPGDRPQHPAEVRDTLRGLVVAVKQGKLTSAARVWKSPVPRLAEQAQAQATMPLRRPMKPIAIEIVNNTQAVEPIMIMPQMPSIPKAPSLPVIMPLMPIMPTAPKPASLPVVPPAPASLSSLAAMPPPPLAAAPPELVVPAPAAVPSLAAVDRPSDEPALPSDVPARQQKVLRWAALVVAVLVAGGLMLRGTFVPKPPAKPAVAAAPAAPAPRDPNALADSVRPLMKSLVEGATREERVSAAQSILLHVPVDEVPAYGRAMAHLQLAETCLQKKQQLTLIDQVDDVRTLPVLVALSQRKKGGCGPKGKEDCLACLRDDLARIMQRFEARALTPATPPTAR
ncbi:MAG TPA: serine/threonine-protein kinase, partial [Polyangiales bacterium]|nr:serine/threonine-protein kinase [Polyangiales bacterium]